MFRDIKKAKAQLAQVNHYFESTVEHIEENRDAYRAGVIGFGIGAGVVLMFRSRPVVVNNVINLCAH